MLSLAEVMRLLDLKPHPEGGHYRQTFRDPRTVDGARAASTAIYFLLARGERSRWHGPQGTTDGSLSSARGNLSSDLYFRGVRQAGTVEKPPP